MVTLKELRELGADPEGRQIKFKYGFHTEDQKWLLEAFLAGKRHSGNLNGWDTLSDAGCFSRILTHPAFTGQVVKISLANDMAYRHYIEQVVLPNQHNPHVPAVHGYVRLKDGSFLVLMERLEEIVNERFAPKRLAKLSIIRELIEGKHRVGQRYGRQKLTEKEAMIYQGYLPDHLLDLCKRLRRNPERWEYDLKTENIMLRGTDLVITDPYCLE